MANAETSGSLRVAVYARVSTSKQASVPEQVESCRQLATRLGHRVGYILRDEGASGASVDRPGYQRLLDLVTEGRIQGVVVWKLDRLIRSLRHMLNLSNEFEEKGIALFSVTEQFDTNSAFGKFAFRTMASAAELERDIIGERSQLGRQTMAVAGKWPGKHPPLGYSLLPGRDLAVDERTAETVRRVFSMYKRRIPTTEIALRLAETNHVGQGGLPLSTYQISKVVRNPVYIGKLVIMDREHSRPDLRLIRDATWQAAQARHGTRCDDGNSIERKVKAMDRIHRAYLRHLRSENPAE